MKRGIILAILVLILIQNIIAQDYKIEVSTSKETFAAGENISVRVSLLDSQNNPINENVNIVIEDAEGMKNIEQTIPSNEFVDIYLGDGVNHGYWSILATYSGAQAKSLFMIEAQELAKFELNGDKLTVTNIGNIQYSRTVQIIIGDTIGARTPKLDVGESIEYRLIAPEGAYQIKVTDGITTLSQGEVQLTGTGQAIGALDERTSQRSGITGGISPNEEDDFAILSYIKKSSLVYVFIFIVFGVAILLAIQRKAINSPHKNYKR